MKVSVDRMRDVIRSFRKDIQQQIEAVQCEREELRHKLHKSIWDTFSNDYDPIASIESISFDHSNNGIVMSLSGTSTTQMLYNDVVESYEEIEKLNQQIDMMSWEDYRVERMLYQIDLMALDNEIDLRLVMRYGYEVNQQKMIEKILMTFREGQECVATCNI